MAGDRVQVRTGRGRAGRCVLAAAAAVLCMLAAARFVAAQAPGAATISAVVAGDRSLTVVWDPPAGTSGSDVTAYDVRYIETSADETVDSNWDVVSSAWTSGPRHYMIDGLTNNTSYDVQVRAVTTTAGEWSATVDQTPSDAGGAVSSAVELPLDVPVAGVIDSATDVDVFKVTVPAQFEVLIYTTGDLETKGSLQTSSSVTIATSTTANFLTTANNFLIWGTVNPGTYYISVSSDGGSTGSYTLHTESIVNTTGFDDAAPVGVDTTANAVLDSGSSHTDYYRLDLDTAADLLIYTTGPHRDTLGTVYDSDRQQVATSDDSYLHTVHHFAIRVRLEAGTHYLTVRGWSPSYYGPYTLHVQEVAEPGSSRSSATALALDGLAGGNIDPASDVDYFRIDVDHTALAQFVVTSATAGVNGALLDSGGNTITGGVQYTSVGADDLTRLRLDRGLNPGTYYLRVDTSGWSSLGGPAGTGAYAVAATEDLEFRALIEQCRTDGSVVQDRLYGCQWNLANTGQFGATAGEDINVADAWAATLGSGVAVAVVDSRADPDHDDLTDNFDETNSHDYLSAFGVTAGPDYHGTAVAGIVAARDNAIGIRGVAPRATIRSYNLLQFSTDANEADAMSRHAGTTAVNTNSWGPPDNGRPHRAPRSWELAVEHGLAEGYSGLGTFYAFAAGNGGGVDDANLDGYVNFYGVTAVCAVNNRGVSTSYSENGANLWVCAPSRDFGGAPGIVTTFTDGGYTTIFGGTSAAAPQVAGVAALVRAANTSLSWRDVKLILAESARKNDPDHAGWQTGASKYGSGSENYEFNHSYGFGVVDAGAAVELAQDWTNVPALRSHTATGTATPVTVGSAATTTFSESSAVVGPGLAFVEFVEVNVVMTTASVRHLEMELESPQGAVSKLLVPSREGSGEMSSSQGPWRLGSARHLGENPAGEWTLRLRDRIAGGSGSTLHSWTITVYGHGLAPGPPAITSVDGVTDPVTVSWEAPDDTGGSAVTGYDLRYVATDTTGKEDDWTVVSDVWSSGALEYTVTGLSSGIEYAFQVRAVSSSGAGVWSSTVVAKVGETVTVPRFGPAETGMRSVAENTAAGVDIGDPVAATDDDGDTLTYTATGVDAAGFSLDAATGQLSTSVELDHESQDSYQFDVTATDPDGYRDTIAVTVSVTDVNEPPELDSIQQLSRENDVETGVYLWGTDPEDTPLRWSVAGTDGALFSIADGDPTDFWTLTRGPYKQLVFVSPPDRENPHDDDGDNDYEVTVEVSDGTHTTSEEFTVWPYDVDEPPVLSGIEARDYPEGSTEDVAVYRAEDPEGGTIRWTLAGADRDAFSLVDGVLRFRTAPDYENPHDQADSLLGIETDNVYELEVRASDNDHSTGMDVTVTVTNVDDPGSVSLSSSQPVVGTGLTATLSDGDGGVSGLSWIWQRSSDRAAWSTISGAVSASYTPVAADLGLYLQAVAAYRDGHGSGKSARADTADPVGPEPQPNGNPQFLSTETGRRTVAENTPPGRDVGDPVAATDPDRDALTYVLGGDDAASFEIVSSTGQIRTSAALDHEAKSSYAVTVSVRDNFDADDNPDTAIDDMIDVEISVSDVNEAPTLTGDTEPSFAENGTGSVAGYTASDPEGASLVWSLSPTQGQDSGLFEITQNGMLYFKDAPDFEARSDADRDNTFEVRVQVSDATNTTYLDVDVAVTDVNEAPVLAAGASSVTRHVAENTPQGRDVGSRVAASDPEDDSLVYSLGDRDASLFEIVASTGQIRTSAALDHEIRSSYSVTVSVSDNLDADGDFDPAVDDTVAVTVRVDDVDEAPVLSGDTEPGFDENATGAVAVFDARDPEGVNVVWSLSGTDAGDLELSQSGVLSFADPPDFEDAADSNRDNVYKVRVTATDGANPATLGVEVTVRNVDEAGAVSGMPTQPQEGTAISVSVTDPDGAVAQTTWQWERFLGGSRAVIPGATAATYVPSAADVGTRLRVTASYRDGHGSGKSAQATTANTVRAAPVTNRAPEFPASETGRRNVLENTAPGVAVGAPLSASDLDGDALTYTASGADSAAFDIDASTGQLLTKDSLDRETKSTYRFTVVTEDPSGETDQIPVTVTVDDIDEAPELGGPTAVNFPENRATEVARYQARDPEGATISWSLAGPDNSLFTITAGMLRFGSPPDYEQPAGAGGNQYRVNVVAGDGPSTQPGTLESTIRVTVTVTPVDEPPEITGLAAVERPENTTAVSAYSAVDPEGDDFDWSLEGPDRDQFDLAADGTLSFKQAPDYEARGDADRDNRYELTLRASGNAVSSSLPVTVTITNADDPGTVTFSDDEPEVDSQLTATLNDPDGGISGQSWQWERSPNLTDWTEIDGVTASSYTPTLDDDGHYLRATVRYTDGHGPSKAAQARTANPVTKLETSTQISGPDPGDGGGGGGG
ncbi:MAG: S8 family serine peptidase, partial [Acidimicrobiaceae bacterium]|nr:S8 family serine peptidase [Acidimicrobiaceae bacterium]